MVQSAPASIQYYVNPDRGNNSATGDRDNPYKTLTRALQQARTGSTIYLSAGIYNTASGETFPLVVPEGVTLIGDEGSRGQSVRIEGGGSFSSGTFGAQSVGLVLANGSRLQGLTITNPVTRGTGIWIEGSSPAIARCTLTSCGREGIFVTGNARPEIVESLFRRNAASGISIVRNAKGELRHNIFQQTGYGIAISDQAAPLLADNQLIENHSGIVLSRSAQPVLRNNTIANNTRFGLVVRDVAQPDLGKPLSPGGNVFQNNAQADISNDGTVAVLSVGNQVSVTKTTGLVNFGAIAPNSALPSPTSRSLQIAPANTAAPPVPSSPPPSPPATAPTPASALTDIRGYWAEGFIQGLVQQQVISGFTDNTFRPELLVTRAQYAVFVSRAFSVPEAIAPQTYSDVPSGFWAAEAVTKAQRMGFLTGFPDGTFRPNQNMTRIQVIESLVNGLELTGGTPNSLQVYRDRAQIPSQSATAIATATQKRIVVNHPLVDQLNPMQEITRAQLAAILYQAMMITGKARAIASPFIVEPPLSAASFSDIQGHWAADFIRGLANQGFIRGFVDGTFRPNNLMTRAEFAALLSGTFNPLPERSPVQFSDVPGTFWAAGVIQRAYRGKWLSGFDDGTFRPQDNLLRLHVILSLASGLGLPAGDRQLLDLYTDKAQVPTWAANAVAAATGNSIVVNHPQLRQLNPNQPATRADVCAMVYQALAYAERAQPLTSSFVVRPGAAAPSPGGSPQTNAPVVVLDPGHGGSDSGTVGIGGLKEKEVVLPIAQSVAQQLQAEGIRAVLTRSNDSDRTPEERIKIAEDNRAEVLVSIHANALSLSRFETNGVETYYYRTSEKGGQLAQLVHDNVLQMVDLKDLGLRQASFTTLRQATMPSIVVEVGYVTTQTDDTNLIDTAYIKTLATGIANGIKEYVRRNVSAPV